MRQALVPLAIALATGLAAAKLPPPSEEAKAKAAETAAKAAWQAKVDAYDLCKAQDRIAAMYRKGAGQQAAPAKAASPAPAAAAASKPASASAGGTPVTASAPTPCSDPGPFAYNQPLQKPLETSEAHSPAGTAASPPSTKESSGAAQAPKKP